MNKKILVLFFILLMALVSPVSAFSDDFSDGDITDWTLDGSWSAATFRGVSTTSDAVVDANPVISNATKILGIDHYFFNVTLNESFSETVTETGYGYARFYFGANATGNYANVYLYELDAAGVMTRYFDVDGMTFASVATSENTDYIVSITITGSNINVKLYSAVGVLLSDQTSAYSYSQSTFDRIVMESSSFESTSGGTAAMTATFDNITTSVVGPGTSTSISFDADSYVVGDYPIITWAISDADYAGWFDTYRAYVYLNGEVIQQYNTITSIKTFDLPGQTGSTYKSLESVGNYKIELRRSNTLFLAGMGDLLASDEMVVNPVLDSWIKCPSTVGAGKAFTCDYLYGIEPSDFTGTGIKTYFIDSVGNEYFESSYDEADADYNTLYNKNITVHGVGSYHIELWDIGYGEVGSWDVISKPMSGQFETTITTSFVNLTQDSYVLGENFQGYYGIDNANLTDPVYLAIYNYNLNTYFSRRVILDQVGDFYGTVGVKEEDCTINENGLKSCSKDYNTVSMTVGNNVIRLLKVNATTETILAHDNFTVSNIDVDGYGLSLVGEKKSYCTNEDIKYLVNTPLVTNVTIVNLDKLEVIKTVGGEGAVKTILVNTTGKIFNFKTSQEGNYEINLLDANDQHIRLSVDFSVNYCTVITPKPTIDYGADYNGGSNDLGVGLKAFIIVIIGGSIASLFIGGVVVVVVMIVACLAISQFKSAAFGVLGGLMGVGIDVYVGLWDMVWAVMIVIFVGLMFMAMMKKG